jgi:hypothetical protein
VDCYHIFPEDKLKCSHIYLPFTRFSLGFFRLAAALALRVDEASIAPADFIDIPCFLEIDFCTDLNPGCFI